MRHLVLTLLVALVIAGGAPRTLEAHARMERAEPAADSTVANPPTEVRIWMTQELTLGGNSIVVTDSAGMRVDNDDARVDQSDPSRKQLVATLGPLSSGTYSVTYVASSAEDGHSFEETYSFTVDAPSGSRPTAEPARRPA